MLEFKSNKAVRDLSLKTTFNELLQIARIHVVDPKMESVDVWCPLKRNAVDENHVISATGASHVRTQPQGQAEFREGLFGPMFPLQNYSLVIYNPQILPHRITVGKNLQSTFPEKIFVRNSAGCTYAEILLRAKKAIVDTKFIPYFERLGFTCREADAPNAEIQGYLTSLRGPAVKDAA